MSAVKAFFDTNVLLYLLSADSGKADRAEEVVAAGGIISVQVLNEFASVCMRKLGMSLVEIRDALTPIRTICSVVPSTELTHDHALQLAERHRFSIYDALIVAAARDADCTILYSEDMQHGQLIDGELTLSNPFAHPARR